MRYKITAGLGFCLFFTSFTSTRCPGQSLTSQCFKVRQDREAKKTSDSVVRVCAAELHPVVRGNLGQKTLNVSIDTAIDTDDHKKDDKDNADKTDSIQFPQGSLDASVWNECNPNQAFIVHVAHWITKNDDEYALGSSRWYVYRATQKIVSKTALRGCMLELSKYQSNDEPLLYAEYDALLIGVTIFDGKPVSVEKVAVDYKVSTTPQIPENIADLGALVEAFFGGQATKVVSPSGKTAAPLETDTFVAVTYIPPLSKLPFDFNVSYSLAVVGVGAHTSPLNAQNPIPPTKGQNSNQTAPVGMQAVDCSNVAQKSPCTITRSFRSEDREYFDFSLAVSIPGVRETTYKAN